MTRYGRAAKNLRNPRIFRSLSACILIAIGSSANWNIQAGEPAGTNRLEKLEKENADLKQRLDALEAVAQKEGLLPSGSKADPPVSAMSAISLSGFVTASYFHDSSRPPASLDHKSPGYLWNRV